LFIQFLSSIWLFENSREIGWLKSGSDVAATVVVNTLLLEYAFQVACQLLWRPMAGRLKSLEFGFQF
jgi:ABC-type cobalt transport system substrate-binding protein